MGVKVRYSGTKAEKRSLRRTVVRIRDLLDRARAKKALCVFLIANSSRLYAEHTDFRWDTEIHDELSPKEKEPIFLRDNPSEDPFLSGLGDFLKSFSTPRLLLCGFYGNKCVWQTAFGALDRKLPVSFIIDCVFPNYDTGTQDKFLNLLRKNDREDEIQLVSFCTMSDLFPNA